MPQFVPGCQKCRKEFGQHEARWMFSPPGFGIVLQKCQGCGKFTAEEEKVIVEKLNQMTSVIQNKQVGGCNCQGKR